MSEGGATRRPLISRRSLFSPGLRLRQAGPDVSAPSVRGPRGRATPAPAYQIHEPRRIWPRFFIAPG